MSATTTKPARSRSPAKAAAPVALPLLAQVRELILQARQQVAQTVNAGLTLLYWAFGAIGLLASASFDRLSPALSLSLAVVLISYFLEVLGSLWPDASWLQPYSLFHYVDPKATLAGLPVWRCPSASCPRRPH